jgi:chemotaxis protein MotB
MARTHPATTVKSLGISLLAAATLTGCVSQEKYAALQMQRNQLVEQLGAAQSQANSERGQREILSQQLAQIRNSGDNRDALLVNQAATIADLQRQLEELNGRYTQAVNNAGKLGATALPVQLTNALTEFAAQNPGLVDFDPARGLVKFKSDVTFPVGSADVRPEARAAIDRFAQILNSPAAANYDLMVVGHTDSQPVHNPATKAAGHHDNWYLSAHRAISVSKELQRQRVNSTRLQVAGFADQRPVDPSPTKEAWAKNRRVEVLILPTQGSTATASTGGTPGTPATPAPRPATGGPNKDTTGTGNGNGNGTSTADIDPRRSFTK